MEPITEAQLMHYGIKRRSGRYPWGSGGNEQKRSQDFLGYVSDLRKQGLTDAQIAEGLSTKTHPFTSTTLKDLHSDQVNKQKLERIRQAERLRATGMSTSAIGREMGINESSVRSLLAPSARKKIDELEATKDMLRREVDKKKYVQIGVGTELALPLGEGNATLPISKDKLSVAVTSLREEGYVVRWKQVPQLGVKGNYTTVKFLQKEGDPYPKIDQIRSITESSPDHGRSFVAPLPPKSISSKRVGVVYKEDGGEKADGVIFVRPGVKDVSLGGSQYAQVRIKVDNTHYLKGMAVYKDGLPKGVDLEFHTNKSNTGNKLDALKKLQDDPENPFGAVITAKGQITTGIGDKRKVTSVMNKLNEEGDWDKWSKTLSSQMLSKQRPEFAKEQLDMMYKRKREELDEISALTNPVVKKKLLDSFSDDADASAVHLKAAALPNQASHVILPVSSMKPNEIYAPNHNNGDSVALIRYPHAGTFEIPVLTVNNKNKEAQHLLGLHTKDAVGIHHSVAQHLSGADFDGDTVLVIRNNHGKVRSKPPLSGLKDFDPMVYQVPKGPPTKKFPDGVPTITPSHKGRMMGDVTNLISDMTVKGASDSELTRAVRHSMVVIDSEKHNLDYKASARDNGISALKLKYQRKPDGKPGGASTLLTRSTSDVRIRERRLARAAEGGPIDKRTGEKRYVNTGATYVNGKGETVFKMEKHERGAIVKDANSLVSDHGGTRIERVYAEHANRLKALGNEARKEGLTLKYEKKVPSAERTYQREVGTLNAKLNKAEKNRPLERQAQVFANAEVEAKKKANSGLEPDQVKKLEQQALARARDRTGAKKERIDITPEEWRAIQAHAISSSKLRKILEHTDVDKIKELATPRERKLMTPTKTARAKTMLAAGYTQAEVAAQLGVSLTTLKVSLSGGDS